MEKAKMIEDITGGDVADTALLGSFYNMLHLERESVSEQYAILNMIYHNKEKEFDGDMYGMRLQAEAYKWWPEEVKEFKELRKIVVNAAYDYWKTGKYDASSIPDNIEYMRAEAYRVSKNYDYATQDEIDKEIEYLYSEIQQDLYFINGITDKQSMGLVEQISDRAFGEVEEE